MIKHKPYCLHHQKGELGDTEDGGRKAADTTFYPLSLDFARESNTEGQLQAMHKARCDFEQYLLGNNAGIGNSLLALLSLRRGLGVSDPRDMIYAHLGIASDALSGRLNLDVDYQRDFVELFTELAIHSISAYGDYRVLAYVEVGHSSKSRANLSSWVPDWTSKVIHNLWEIPAFPIRPPCDILQSLSFPWSQGGKRQLKSSGRILARIDIVGSNVLSFAHFTREEIRDAWSRWVEFCEDSSDQPFESEILLGPGFDDIANLAGMKPEKLTRPDHSQHPPKDVFDNAWFKDFDSLLGIGGPFFETEADKRSSSPNPPIHPAVIFIVLCFRFFPLPTTRHDKDRTEHQFIQSLQEFQRAMEGRKLSMCDGSFKYIDEVMYPAGALVPRSTQVGDLICQLDGDPRYVVLRAADQVDDLLKEGTVFEFVGMCYIGSYISEEIISGTFILE